MGAPYGAAPGAGYAPPMPQAQGSWAGTPAAGTGEKGFFGSLFDFSFSSFVTTKLIKVIYGLLIVSSVFVGIGVFFRGIFEFTSKYGSEGLGILFIILSPVVAFLYLLLARLYCELIIVMFRIAETLRDINRKTKE